MRGEYWGGWGDGGFSRTVGEGDRTLDKIRESSGNSTNLPMVGSAEGSNSPAALPFNPDFRILETAWPTLPAALKAGIVAMVKAATGENKQ